MPPKLSVLQADTAPALPASSHGASAPAPTALGAFPWAPSSFSVSFLPQGPKSGCNTLGVILQVLRRGNKLLPWSFEYTSVDAAGDAVSLHRCQGSLLDRVWPKSHQNTGVLSRRAAPWPSPYQCRGLVHTKCRALYLSGVNIIMLLLGHS